MPDSEASPPGRTRKREGLTKEERRSVTHGDFWIPEEEREKYKRAIDALNGSGVPYVVSGTYAIYEYTGIYRETKDLDVFVEPARVIDAMRALRAEGFTTRLEQAHWLAKAKLGPHFVDVIFGMGNGLALIDPGWYENSHPAILAARQVRVAPAEELIWHRLFISERHRQDMADIVHLIQCVGQQMDWQRLIERTGPHWPLLLAQLQVYGYVYPESEGRVPRWVTETLLEKARADLDRPRTEEAITRGPLVSRFSFTIDVKEWGLRDLRDELIAEVQKLPVIKQLAASDVWDEQSDAVGRYREKMGI